MPLVYASIMPHGGDIIPELASRRTEISFSRTRGAVRKIARMIKESKPDAIIIASPHNLRLQDNIGIVTTESSTGHLRGHGTRNVHLKLKCDRSLAQDLLKESRRRKLPVVGANYGTSEGPPSDMAMDWGTLVPLWFVSKEERMNAPIVIVTPSREIPLKQNIAFGKLIAKVAEKNKRKRVVFVASADQAHAHKASGPYGYHRAAAKYDSFVTKAIQENRIGSISNLSKKFVEDAKPDSLWQMAMLAGITQSVTMRGDMLSYEVPTYYGMICASYTRV